jgi:two-component system sensor histidine kinase KdpD
VSHDLRTPLAAIAGSASRLLDAAKTKLPDDDRDLLATIVRESHRLTRLVENLLEMTRLQSGAVALNRQWHVLEEIVGSARSRLREELADHPIDVDIPADFPLLFIDGILMEQVFVNLLENAARYTPTGTAIEIGAAVLENEVEITIADRGPGLPEGSERKVFEKFYRAGHAVPADGSRGVGLGLAICQAIVKVHGGDVSARNRPEGGSEFTIRLPKKSPPKMDL